MSLEDTIEHAKRAFALKKYEQSVEHYASALEIATKKFGEKALETADLYFAYGKALLENAIAQSSVLGKQEPDDALEDSDEAARSGAFLSFSGDADDDQTGEDVAVDLFAEARKAADEADAAAEEQEEDDGEPEDDFNAAWEVLDLARAIYEKQQDESDEVKLKLADTFIALGDVSLETEKFEQAITDYTAGLGLKNELLPLSSRQIAEAHYKLSIVLDLTSGRLADAIVHAERALDSVEARLAELRDALSGQGFVKSEQLQEKKEDVKGKGKATGSRLLADDAIEKMTKGQMEAEEKELQGLREDLALKVDELKTAPNEPIESAPALAAKALDAALNASPAPPAAAAPTEVHDLTGLVKKKKKNPETNGAAANGAAKRKAEDDGEDAQSEKKAKLEEAAS
ncbi:hypothetical protein BV20DRAFT_1036313 [Pilatotrama ljubarskyi]|nr:hypothetical protein BV20DRAFT_1036313 [Pilatotrama ljubarskyi]